MCATNVRVIAAIEGLCICVRSKTTHNETKSVDMDAMRDLEHPSRFFGQPPSKGMARRQGHGSEVGGEEFGVMHRDGVAHGRVRCHFEAVNIVVSGLGGG